MMSLHALASGQEIYYLRAVAEGAEEYYTEGGEVPGRWLGSLAESGGLVGEVNAADLRSVLAGVMPSSGERIAGCNRKNAAIDLTLSVPKSVSVLWAFGDDAIAEAVIEAHDQAVDVAIGYLEREAAKARRGKAGWETVDGEGLLGAGFRHRTSRLGDPQLHTHVLVANATRCGDGQWRSLHGRYVFHHARAAGHLYQVELRHALTAALGVSWTPTVKGFAEIEGIPVEVLAEFSRRRVQVVAEQERSGDHTQAGARRAAEKTRPAKEKDLDYQALRADWATRARSRGFTVEDVPALLEPQRDPQQDAVEVYDASIAELVIANRSSYGRRQPIIAVANLAPVSWTAERVEERADEYLAGRHAVAAGVSMFGITYSTAEHVEIERQVVVGAEARMNSEAAVCPHASEMLDRAVSLSAEQRAMVEAITSSGDGVSVVVGAAGSGKTHALGVARDIWTMDGYTVIGAALAARAAAHLQEGSLIPSCSLDRLLGQLDSDRLRLWCDTVLVIDEAAMLGTRKLARILDHAHKRSTKVVLVGDHHQLPEIEAGGAFAALAERLGAITLEENRRQVDPAERAALTELRTGDSDHALVLLAATGNLHEHDSRATASAAIVDAWLGDLFDEGVDSIMLATSRADVTDLNDLARSRLRAEGGLDDHEVVFGERGFSVGDWVMTTRNDYALGVLNGRRGVVTDIAPDGAWIDATVGENCSNVTLRRDQLDGGLLAHAYAMTIHKAQGITCDTAHVLGDESLYREAAYTALSRGRQANHLYVAPAAEIDDSHLPEGPYEGGLDALTRALARSREQRLASIDLRTLPSIDWGAGASASTDVRPAQLDRGLEV